MMFVNPRDASRDLTQWDLKLKRVYTLDMFLNEITSREEWGNISIFSSGRRYMTFSYNHENISIAVCKELKQMIVKSATAIGGWGAMDYIIHI